METDDNGGVRLSPRQNQVLRLAGKGLSIPEIAQELGISRSTAKVHCDTIRMRFGLKHKRELVMVARHRFPEDV